MADRGSSSSSKRLNTSSNSTRILLAIVSPPCSVDCLVRITSLSYPGVSDTSNKNFIIDCPLVADLSGDCAVDKHDMRIFAEQWLASGDPADCPLSADFAGDDCKVNLQDFAVLASEWLEYFN